MAYSLTGKKSGTVRFEQRSTGVIEKESESYSSSVTSNPIEDGGEINDHVNNAAGTLSISGTIIGGDGAISALKAMRAKRELITYIGVTRMSNLVFTSLKFDRSHKNKNGASFSATLRQVQTAASEFVPMDAAVSMTSQDDGRSPDRQLAKTSNYGLTVIAIQTVSSSSAERYEAAYKRTSSSAPLTRQTGSYAGLEIM